MVRVQGVGRLAALLLPAGLVLSSCVPLKPSRVGAEASNDVPKPAAPAPLIVVRRVIDGDTLVLEDGRHVRLIGVDTPELHHPSKPVMFFAEEAYRFTRRLVEGKPVRLEYDQQRIDRYKRTLAYVYLQDGTLVNAEIIKQGYGFAYTKFPFRDMEAFRQYERKAREQERGLWGPLVGDPDTSHLVYLYESLTLEGKRLAMEALERLKATHHADTR